MSDSDIVRDFLVESYENLDRLDRGFVGLERNPKDQAALAGVFRTIHTIKGTCGFLGFAKLEKVAHVGENLLTRLRDGHLAPEGTWSSPDSSPDSSLEMSGQLKQLVERFKIGGASSAGEYSPKTMVAHAG